MAEVKSSIPASPVVDDWSHNFKMKCRKFNNALYENAQVANIPTSHLIETGSTIIILNSMQFRSIIDTDRPELRG